LVNGFWKTKPGFDTLELLLKNGAKGESVNKSLLLAITEFNMEPLAEPFMDLLLNWNADVNYNEGRSIQLAATQGNIQILPRLFVRHASVELSLMALPYLFISGVKEEGMLSLLQLFVEYLGDNIAQPLNHPQLPDAVVFLSIRHYPKSHRVLKAVLDAGFVVDQRMYHELGDGNERNYMTALFWALSLPKGTVSETVIETLIAYGGECSNDMKYGNGGDIDSLCERPSATAPPLGHHERVPSYSETFNSGWGRGRSSQRPGSLAVITGLSKG
jgi:hypothetical protein